MSAERVQYLIIGAGIVGMSLADRLLKRSSDAQVVILEKEDEVAAHASGRNSGVLHAGIYYSSDTLKARFTIAGNRAMREFCGERGLKVNECGKLIVASNAHELDKLFELERRGIANGAEAHIIDAAEAEKIDPNVSTFNKALYSPHTATIDPGEICGALKSELMARGVEFRFGARVLGVERGEVVSTSGTFAAERVINCAGLYADQIARHFGFGKSYTMLPFKGLYLKYARNQTDVRTNIYPVPNLKMPFLEVHFTKTVNGDIKIGPTAIPAFWRENYRGFDRFDAREMAAILGWEAWLFLTNAFNFRTFAVREMRKYRRSYLIATAAKLVKGIDPDGFGEFTRPGIRAQLLDRHTSKLVQDFVVEGDRRSVHILNAVSPAFTCAFPFSEYVIEHYLSQ